MDNEDILIRYTSAPTKFDYAPFGTLCSVLLNDEGTELEMFIQTSRDENDPAWISAAEILLKVYKPKITEPKFLKSLLSEY